LSYYYNNYGFYNSIITKLLDDAIKSTAVSQASSKQQQIERLACRLLICSGKQVRTLVKDLKGLIELINTHKTDPYNDLNQLSKRYMHLPLTPSSSSIVKKHICILDELEVNGLIQKCESPFGKRVVMVYKATQKGKDFCRSILEPYDRMFPRKKESVLAVNNTNSISNSNDMAKYCHHNPVVVG
jgi:DNA-binding PadR family transcriptional regulator